MIKATRMDDDNVDVTFSGDLSENRDELISILIHALSLYSEDDILRFLAVAVDYTKGNPDPSLS